MALSDETSSTRRWGFVIPIRWKVILLVVFVSSVGLALAAFGRTWLDRISFERELAQGVRYLAGVTAEYNQAALIFDDPDTATTALALLRGNTHIESGAIYRRDGSLFAAYVRNPQRLNVPDRLQQTRFSDFAGGYFLHYQPIQFEGRLLGYVFLRADTKAWEQKLRSVLAMYTGLYLLVMLVALLLAANLQRFISRPISSLLATASNVIHTRDYSLRAQVVSRDEMGQLVESFNRMLGVMQAGEKLLQASYAELEQKVDERTREYMRAKNEALEASRAKSAFLANMSHEIRTPLNAILGYAQILAQDPSLAEKHAHNVQSINRAGTHLLGLINEVLDLSKIDARRMTVNARPFDLVDFLEGMAEMFRLRCREKNLVWAQNLSLGDSRIVIGDSGKLAQVLINFLGNAVKFTDLGQVGLSVSRHGDNCLFRIEDTGPGIPAEAVDSIFEPFQQGEAGRLHGGTGLGLPIARGLVELMGGEVTLESPPAGGACFSFEIPLPGSDQLPAKPAPTPHAIARRLPDGQRLGVLVVDDARDIRAVLTGLLESAGIGCRTAMHGREALERVREARPDVVFMDLRMPVMDGFEALARLHTLYGERMPPCVAITGAETDLTEKDLLEHGFAASVAKPFDLNAILDTLQQLLGLEFVVGGAPGPAQVQPELPVVLSASVLHIVTRMQRFVGLGVVSEMRRLFDQLEQLPEGSPVAAYLRPAMLAYDFDALEQLLDQLIVERAGGAGVDDE